jgi:hypothetical protein
MPIDRWSLFFLVICQLPWTKEDKVNIISMPIEEVIPYDRNPRRNDPAVDAVARSIEEFGFRQPIAKSAVCITDTRVLRDRKHRLAWLVLRYRSASDGELARFAWDSRLLREGLLGRHSIRRVSGRLAELPDGVLARDNLAVIEPAR